jgi:hypothetical protein
MFATYLGNGDGSFAPGSVLNTAPADFSSLAVLDVNSDGVQVGRFPKTHYHKHC